MSRTPHPPQHVGCDGPCCGGPSRRDVVEAELLDAALEDAAEAAEEGRIPDYCGPDCPCGDRYRARVRADLQALEQERWTLTLGDAVRWHGRGMSVRDECDDVGGCDG